jgi:colanic acid biosynthesis glycosyl transferase WcaI
LSSANPGISGAVKVLVLGLNYPPEAIAIAIYTGGLCKALAAAGHEVMVVAGKPYYPAWRVFEGWRGGGARRSREHGIDVLHVPHYVPSNPTGMRRILHHLTFAASVALPLAVRALRRRPDIVVAVAPSLIAAPLARLAARLCGAKCWLHVQDFEVEAALATGLVGSSGWIGSLARTFERRVIGGFDGVSSISHEMCLKLARMGVPPERIYEFRNWSDVDAVRPLTGPSPFRREWNIATPHVALYSGNIANKQGIEIVAEAARLLQNRTDLTFVVCGNGPNRAALMQASADLKNLLFKDLQPIERLPDLLGLATVHLLPQRADAADLVLPSKLTNMLASGRPVVATAAPGTGLHREVEGCGIATPPGDAAAFAATIEQLIDDPQLHRRTSLAARRRAETVWEKNSIVGDFIARLAACADCDPEPSALPARPLV